MHLHLYRPVMLSRAGRGVCITDAREVSPREVALLVALRWATWVGENSGTTPAEPMNEATPFPLVIPAKAGIQNISAGFSLSRE